MTPLWGAALGLALSVVSASEQRNWAVIVAGSNGYWNYRHQVGIILLLLCAVRTIRPLSLVSSTHPVPVAFMTTVVSRCTCAHRGELERQGRAKISKGRIGAGRIFVVS